jgi:hypothetical protein
MIDSTTSTVATSTPAQEKQRLTPQEEEALQYSNLCTVEARSKRSREADEESPDTKQQRVQYEFAHARVAKWNRDTAQEYLEKHEEKVEEYTLALMALGDDHNNNNHNNVKLKAQYTKLIQHHYNKIKKAKQDALRFQKEHEHHLRKLKLAAWDLKHSAAKPSHSSSSSS